LISPLVFWAAAFLLISLVGLFVASKLIKMDLEKNGELIIAMLTILGTLVSVLLGLLVSSADGQYRSLEACVQTEATSVNQVFGLSRGLPPPIAHDLQDRCVEYCEKVVSDEWPSMRHGQISQAVNQVFSGLSRAIVDFNPSNNGEVNIHAALISAASSIEQNRESRLVASRSSWTRRLLPLILTCAIVVLACSYLYVGRGNFALHAVLVGLVAVTLGTNIGVIFLMTRPFSSEWTIQPEGFELQARVMRQLMKKSPPTEIDIRPKARQ
jgi:hypothetical protein